ncbi:hypothetical protein A6A04_04070 [Paramagnetospirillum marisnigri]|uniref:Uncharacterized protein n=1 Tax=Paramagnetospirillum marisnigri TaxID=1285242 RepID=A0A178MKT5_9PROT|nr:radical SAM protein [Paramagnetospirillum marisnigri]OAN49300.1 hypothetical protein A6A04_04070 [Paramagnetospirillum marisnigri]
MALSLSLAGRPIKVLLVQPSSDNCVQSLFTYHKDHGIGHKPPLGIMILATYLQREGFADVHCLDAQMEEISPEETARRIAQEKPDLVGFTVWTDFWYPAWKTIEETRRLLPDSVIVLGGPHAGCYPKETVEGCSADYLVVGDGEDVLLGMVQDLQAERPVADHPGLWRRLPNGSAQAPSEAMAVVKDLTKIPAPNRLLLPYKRYSSVLTPTDYETTMVTSRGCPYKCVFCKMDVQKVYARTAEQVVDEFADIAALGITDVQVYDDTFTWGHQRAKDICQGIIDRGIKVNWAIRDRVNRVTPDLYKLLKEAGCYRVHFGVETGSQRILDLSGKAITFEQVDKAMVTAREIGMTVMAYFMFGFISETREDALKTIAYANKLDPDYAVFVVLIPYPGTAVYREGMAKGIIPTDFWRDFTLNPQPDYVIPHIIEDELSRQELVSMKNMATRRYYFRPSRILREIRTLSSFRELKSKARLAWMLLHESTSKLTPRMPIT